MLARHDADFGYSNLHVRSTARFGRDKLRKMDPLVFNIEFGGSVADENQKEYRDRKSVV